MQLRFTGRCDAEEFARRCAQHDFWYHSFYFDNGFSQRGDYDIGRDVADYHFPDDMRGMSVLDVGTGSGWFATYFEQKGATVTTLDARGVSDYDVFGRPGYPPIVSEKPEPDRFDERGRPVYYSHHSGGFWIMKDILNLKASYVNARVYDISPDLFGGQGFDLVFMGAVLMHVRDPIGALMAARSVCRDRIIVTSNCLALGDDKAPLMMLKSLLPQASDVDWWIPNKVCLHEWFRAAGFVSMNCDRSVRATADSPFIDSEGHSSAVDQVLQLVHARVPG